MKDSSKANTKVNVILTFYEGSQEQRDLNIPMALKRVDEGALLGTIFNKLSRQQLATLLKISCSFVDARSKNELPAFVQKNMGKFYFNVESNPDLDTIKNMFFKLETLNSKR